MRRGRRKAAAATASKPALDRLPPLSSPRATRWPRSAGVAGRRPPCSPKSCHQPTACTASFQDKPAKPHREPKKKERKCQNVTLLSRRTNNNNQRIWQHFLISCIYRSTGGFGKHEDRMVPDIYAMTLSQRKYVQGRESERERNLDIN